MGILNLFKPNVEKMARKRNVEGLAKALMYKDSYVQHKAAEALGKIGDARAVDPLIQALKDRDDDVQWKAAAATMIIIVIVRGSCVVI